MEKINQKKPLIGIIGVGNIANEWDAGSRGSSSPK